MQQNTRIECPQCSRPLQEFNGHIGYCIQHKWVSPRDLGFDAEATEQNQLDAAAAESRRLAEEQQKATEEKQIRTTQRQSAVRKTIAIITALALIAAAIIFFVVRPSINYSSAAASFAAGDYASARNGYVSLGSYKDSNARVLLCDAMMDLQESRLEDAVKKLEQLAGDGHADIASQLDDSLLSLIADWNANDLSPQALLLLLGKTNIIDPDGSLDIAKLTVEAHTALLDETALSTYTYDIDEDGEQELIALNLDYTVTIYRMTTNSNIRMTAGNDTISSCEMIFGSQYIDSDINAAIACYSEAYRTLPSDDTRTALVQAYQLRSAISENAGDMKLAITDARKAMETANTEDAFTYYYDLNLRNCNNGHNAAIAIEMWNEFAESFATELTRFSAKNRWQADAAQLHIALAIELAAQKDEGCIAELRAAAEMGSDITGAIAEAESHFRPGLPLARLRLMEIDTLENDETKKQDVLESMASEVRTAISEWTSYSVPPADVLVLIHLADDQNIDLTGINREKIYEEAAIASAGNIIQYTFVDWDNDGYKELLTLNAAGSLSLYGMDEKWEVLSSVNTKLSGASYTITDEKAPLIIVLAANKDEMVALTGNGSSLSTLFREQGISRYKADNTTITFSRLLEGSIVRYNDYSYEAIGISSRPVRTGIDWQQNDYPQPNDAVSAVKRYFEAMAYDIPEEALLLMGESAFEGIFSAAKLASLAAPNLPGTVNAVTYQIEDGRELFEVTYPSGAQSIRTWIEVENINGWKLIGAADTYGADLSTTDIDFSVALISLNGDISNTISAKGAKNVYRLLIPSSGRIRLAWQSGTRSVSRTSHKITMRHSTLMGDTVFSYSLQPNPSKQQSKDMFVSPGVYYLTVEANIANAEQYHMNIHFEAEPHVELENNDTAAGSTPVELNTSYSGALSSAKDVDYFSFTLDVTSAVNITLGLPGNGNKTTAFTCTVLSASNGSALATMNVPGNAQLSETGNLYLSSGTYLVQVAKGTAYTSDEYKITVNAGQNGNMESEPNNTPDTANTVPVNEDIHASIGQEGDVDCFTFTLEEDAVIQPKFTFSPTDSSSKTYVLTIMDVSRLEMLKVNIGGKESTKAITPVALTAGTYTVKIENPRFVRQDYTLHLVSTAVDNAEEEPNDSAALATVLTVGQARTGVLTTDADVDYYKVTFAEQTTVTLHLSFAQSTNKSTAFVLTVEQNGKTLWTANIKGDSGGIEQQLQFPAGEYYIKVKPSNLLSTLYLIGIE